MMPTLSPGLFGLRAQDPNAGLSQFQPAYDPATVGLADPAASVSASTTAAPQPFIWGGAGERLTDDDIDARQKRDEQQIAAGMDFSPIGSWTQGAARVAQALVGAWDEKRLDKASAANVKATNDAVAMMADPRANETTIASLLADPTLSPGFHEVAKAKMASMLKPAPALDGHAAQLVAEGLTPGTAPFAARMNSFNTQQEMGTPFVYEQWNPEKHATDKIITTRGAIASATGQGGPEAPPPEAISYLQQNPGMAAHFDEKYGVGASQRYLNGGATLAGSQTFPVR